MANKNEYQGQKYGEKNIQAKSGQKDQADNQPDKKKANATEGGNQSINKSGRSDSDNQE